MDNHFLSLDEIFTIFDSLPGECPVCGERLFYGVCSGADDHFYDIFCFCASGEVSPDMVRKDMIQKSDLEYLIFNLCNTHHKS